MQDTDILKVAEEKGFSVRNVCFCVEHDQNSR